MTTASDDSNGGSPRVSYNVKDLLQEIRDTVGRLEAKLDSKADKADLQALDKRLEALEFFRLSVEVSDANKKASEAGRRWLLPIIVTVGLSIPNLLGYLFH